MEANSEKGWRTHEPYDDLLQIESPLLLKEAIDLIIDNHVKTKKQLCEEVRLCQSDVEAIVNLPAGYLDENKGKGTVVSFKKLKHKRKRGLSKKFILNPLFIMEPIQIYIKLVRLE